MNFTKILITTAGISLISAITSAQNWVYSGAPAKPWTSIASSADGKKLVATSHYEGIFSSSNSGASWIESSNYVSGMLFPTTRQKFWNSIAASSDGVKLAAASFDYGIYTSIDSGRTWAPTTAPQKEWMAIASTGDGNRLVVVEYDGGHIYRSTDSGISWALLTNSPGQNWLSISSSKDGSKLAATSETFFPIWSGGIFFSTNSGQTWTQAANVPGTNWVSVASSDDGTKLIAAAQYIPIYVSTNSGVTWSATATPDLVWRSVASSADGTRLIASSINAIYTSTDSGNTWRSNSLPNGYWGPVASSSDGNQIVAANNNGGVTGSGIWIWQPPTITMARTYSNNLTLLWSTNATQYFLQQNNDLKSTNWINVSPVSTITNGQIQIVLTPTNLRAFYRLQLQ